MADKQLPRVGSAVIIEDYQGRIVLGKRLQPGPNQGLWVIPGGGVEPFESIENAALREGQAETGLVFDLGERVGDFELIVPEAGVHRITFVTRALNPRGELLGTSDLGEPQFFTRQQLLTLTISIYCRKMLMAAGWL